MSRFPLALAAVIPLALAACDNPPDNSAPVAPPQQPAVSVQNQPDGSRTIELNVPQQLAPAIDAMSNPQATYEALRARAGEMSEQAKIDAVNGARSAAEAGARALGQTEAEIQQAGDVAERSARDALGL